MSATVDTPGLCYLRLFDFVNKALQTTQFDLRYVQREFQLYPLVRDVMIKLVLNVTQDLLVPDVYLTPYGVYHVHSYRVVPVSSLVKLLFSSARIGSDVFEYDMTYTETKSFSVEAVREGIALADASRNLNRYMSETNTDFARLKNNFANQICMTRDSDILCKAITAQVRAVNKKPLLIVTDIMTMEQRGLLTKNFPEVQISFLEQSTRPHALAKNVKSLFDRLIYSSYIQYSESKAYLRPGHNFLVVDIGGNYVDHAGKRSLVHCCTPTIDLRDSARDTERLLILQKRSLMNPTMYAQYDNPDNLRGRLRCRNKSELCYEKAQYGVMMHSIYDVSPSALMQMFDSHEFTIVYAVMHFHASMFIKDEGVTASGMVWRKFKTDKSSRIQFDFVGEGTTGYSHDFNDYTEYIKRRVFVTPKGVAVLSEIMDARMDHIVLKFVRCSSKPENMQLSLNNSLPLQLSTGKVFMRGYSFDKDYYTAPGMNVSMTLKPRVFSMDAEFYKRLTGYCMRSDSGAFNLTSVASAASAYGNKFTVNGSDIVAYTAVEDIHDLYWISANIYMRAYIEKYNLGQYVKIMVDQEKAKRESNSLDFCAIFWFIFGCLSDNIEEGSVKLPESTSFMNRIRKWASDRKKRRDLTVDISLFAHVITFEEVVSLNARFDKCDDSVIVQQIDDELTEETNVMQPVYQELLLDKNNGEVARAVRSARNNTGLRKALDKSFAELLVTVNKKDNVPQSLVAGIRAARSQIKLVEESPCSVTDDQLVKISGDGSCCYNSLLTALKLVGIEVEVFKRILLRNVPSGFQTPTVVDELSVVSTSDPATWGSTDTMELVAALFSVNVCIHVDTHCIPIASGHTDTIHIRHTPQHFDAYVTEDIDVNATYKRFVALLYNAVKDTDAKVVYDAYGNVGRLDMFVSRSAYKLMDILVSFDLSKNMRCVLDVGGAPGGFIQLLSSFNIVGDSVSLGEYVFTGNWNIFRQDFMSFNSGKKYSLVVSDLFSRSSFDCFDSEVFLKCVDLTEDDGALIFKLPFYHLCELPALPFLTAAVYKPIFSRSASCEVYLICQHKDVHLSAKLPQYDLTAFKEAVNSYINRVSTALPLTDIKRKVDDIMEVLTEIYKPRYVGGQSSGREDDPLDDDIDDSDSTHASTVSAESSKKEAENEEITVIDSSELSPLLTTKNSDCNVKTSMTIGSVVRSIKSFAKKNFPDVRFDSNADVKVARAKLDITLFEMYEVIYPSLLSVLVDRGHLKKCAVKELSTAFNQYLRSLIERLEVSDGFDADLKYAHMLKVTTKVKQRHPLATRKKLQNVLLSHYADEKHMQDFVCDFSICNMYDLKRDDWKRVALDLQLKVRPFVEECVKTSKVMSKPSNRLTKMVNKCRTYDGRTTMKEPIGLVSSVTATERLSKNLVIKKEHTRYMDLRTTKYYLPSVVLCVSKSVDEDDVASHESFTRKRRSYEYDSVGTQTPRRHVNKSVSSCQVQTEVESDNAEEPDLLLDTPDCDKVPESITGFLATLKKTDFHLDSQEVFGNCAEIMMFFLDDMNHNPSMVRHVGSYSDLMKSAVWISSKCLLALKNGRLYLAFFEGSTVDSVHTVLSKLLSAAVNPVVVVSLDLRGMSPSIMPALDRAIDMGYRWSCLYTNEDEYATAKQLVTASVNAVLTLPDEPIVTFPKVNEVVVAHSRAPSYVPTTGPLSNYKNSAIEYKYMHQVYEGFYKAEYTRLYNDTLLCGASTNALDLLDSKSVVVWDTKSKKKLTKKPSPAPHEYAYGFDGKNFVPWMKDSGKFDTDSLYVLLSKVTELMQSSKLHVACELVDPPQQMPLKVEFVNGAPGCGKTTYIIERAEIARLKKVPPLDLVLTTTRAGAVDLRKRLCEKFTRDKITYEEATVKRDVRTVDSYLIAGEKLPYRTIYIDESLMVHAGAVTYCIQKSAAKSVVLMGDKNQIPYIDRANIVPNKFHSLFLFATVTSERNITYRCPQDVSFAIASYYPGLKTCNAVGRSVRIVEGHNGLPPVTPKSTYITWTQDEKHTLLTSGFKPVLTIHEAQGLTFEGVIMWRQQQKPLDLFDSEPHAIVAISRHTKNFTYYTSKSDALTKLALKAVAASEANLMSVQKMGYVPPEVCANTRFDAGNVKSPSNLTFTQPSSHNLLRPIVLRKEVNAPSSKSPVVPSAVIPDTNYFQQVYDDVFPGCSFEQIDYQSIVENADLSLHIDHVTINLDCGEYMPRTRKFVPLRPKLSTMQPALRDASFRESILAYVKRNANAPLLAYPKPPRETGYLMFQNFIRSVIAPDKWVEFAAYSSDIIGVNKEAVNEWLFSQAPGTEKRSSSDIPVAERAFNIFSFMIKRSVKPPLDRTAKDSYASLQTIAYNGKECNVVMCPIFNLVRDRLMSVLKKNILLYSGMSNPDFERLVNNVMSDQILGNLSKVENDFGKFDKSQLEMVYWFEYYLYSALGVDPHIMDIYMNAHRESRFYDSSHGVSAKIRYQRRSGGATTWLGNTLFTLCVTVAMYNIDDIQMLLVSGDDSLFFMKPGHEAGQDRTSMITDFFNLESKFLPYKYSYFCSKFMISVDGHVYMVPDPIKFLTKLGRKDIRNWEHLEEYRISCADSMAPYSNPFIYDELSAAVIERYKLFGYSNLNYLFAQIHALVSSAEAFRQFFYSAEGDLLNMDMNNLNKLE